MGKMIASFIAGLVLALGVCSSVAGATEKIYQAVSPDKSVVVTLYFTPCSNKVSKMGLQPELVAQLQNGRVTLKGKSLDACWGADKDSGLIVVLMENGQHGVLPQDAFEVAESI